MNSCIPQNLSKIHIDTRKINHIFQSYTHRIHVWYICLHLVDFYDKCRQISHTWIPRDIFFAKIITVGIHSFVEFLEPTSSPTCQPPFLATGVFVIREDLLDQSSHASTQVWVVATQTLFIFTSKPGEMIQFDEHIFQMGWFNHQLAGATFFERTLFVWS